MNIPELKQFLRGVVGSDHAPSVMIWSPPGVGKSSAVKQIAEEMGLGFIDLRLSLLNPVDLRGLPTVDREANLARWSQAEFLPDEARDGKKGILFLDEINLAPDSVMKAGYQLILDKKIGNYTLPKGWRVIAAGNRAKDRASVSKFPAPLANRFVHLELDPDFDIWRKWALSAGIHPMIIGFLSQFPQHFFTAPKDLPAGEDRFPTPRSWQFASDLLKMGQSVLPAVGDKAGSEFTAYLQVEEELPNIDEILAGKPQPVSKRLDVLWATAAAILAKAKPEQVPNALRYIFQMPVEFQAMAVLALASKGAEHKLAITGSAEWDEWYKKNEHVYNETANA